MRTKEEKYCIKHAEKYAVIAGLKDYSGIIKEWSLEDRGLDLQSAKESMMQSSLCNMHNSKLQLTRIVKFIRESELNNYNISDN